MSILRQLGWLSFHYNIDLCHVRSINGGVTQDSLFQRSIDPTQKCVSETRVLNHHHCILFGHRSSVLLCITAFTAAMCHSILLLTVFIAINRVSLIIVILSWTFALIYNSFILWTIAPGWRLRALFYRLSNAWLLLDNSRQWSLVILLSGWAAI